MDPLLEVPRCPQVLIYQESSSFVLLGTHSASCLSIPIVIVPRRPFAGIVLSYSNDPTMYAPFFAKIPLEQETLRDYSVTVSLAQI